jgi:prophage regulatory protein
VRKTELQQIVPLANTTIYAMEQRGDFPRRFYFTSRTPVWYLAEVKAWIEQRRRDSEAGKMKARNLPDVRKRKRRPVRQA